jgi:hypothetical protein
MFTCKSLVKLIAALSLVLSFAAPRASAQKEGGGNSSLRLTVSDQGGAVVVSARVSLTPDGGGAEQTAETDEHGAAKFQNVAPGRYRVRVEAQGFEPLDLGELTLAAGRNEHTARLEVARLSEEITVRLDAREERTDPRGGAFTNVLTEEQIAHLPDDPEELEATLRQMAGPGGVLQINGFRGGKLPPKSQIREIRFRLNPYAAENHEAGLMGVDVFTKPGLDSWHGALNFGFRDESLNARNSFAPRRGDEQYRRLGLSFGGPLWRNRASLFVSAEGVRAFDTSTIVAALPGATFVDSFARPSRALNFSARAEHVLTKTHTLRLEYQRNADRSDNLGVGNFDFPERAFSLSQTEHLLRLSDTGMLTPRLVNELRIQARWQEQAGRSVSDEPTLIVLNAFNRGGAQVHERRWAREFTLADNVDFAFSNHTMRVGVALDAGRYSSDASRNANGTFVFANLEDFRAGRPTTFTRVLGESALDFTQYQLGWYWQDDIRLRQDFTLSVGLRHEFQKHLADRNNFAPRVGLAWSPFPDGRMTFRAGAGIFYDWFAANVFEQTLRLDGRRQRELVVRQPGFPDPFDGGAALVLPPSRYERDAALLMPYVAQASASVEVQLPSRLKLISTYSYQRGAHLLRARNVNAPVAGFGRPDPLAGNVVRIESAANSTYSSLNLNLNRFSKGFQFIANYSLSKATDETDGPLSLPADNFDLRPERGPALWDARHRFFAMFSFTLPKELRLSTILNASSATPYNVTTGFDDNGDTVINDRPAGLGRNSARGAGFWDLSTRLSWSFGIGERRESAARGVRVVDTGGGASALGAGSAIPGTIDNRLKFQVYVQVNNLFNHANLTNFTGVRSSPFFGQATAALPSRRVETGLKFEF